MKIQPIDSSSSSSSLSSIKNDSVKPVLKSRLKRFFDRPFPSVLRISSAAEKPSSVAGAAAGAGDGAEFEPSSACLDKMIQNFMEENGEKQTKTGRKCNCFNGNGNESSDDEADFISDNAPFGDYYNSTDALKSLIPCASVAERNLLADASKVVEKNKNCKRKDELTKIITDELVELGYEASICKSKWEKFSSIPAGEYEYIDVIVEGERLLIDVDFRSEFEIARSTGTYKAILQSLPFIFVGKSDRLQQIISIVSEAARHSLKKKGLLIAPWRKPEYMKSKWLSPYTRLTTPPHAAANDGAWESELVEESEKETVVMTWQPPEVKPRSCDRGTKVVTGLASLLREKN